MSMVSVCLPSDALLQHLPSYLGFSYLGCGVSLHSCSSRAQPQLFILDEGCLLTATVPDLQRGIAPLGPLRLRSECASKFGKLSSGHRTGKGHFSFQFQRKAMPKNAQTTVQLHSSHSLAKQCSKFSKPGFNNT